MAVDTIRKIMLTHGLTTEDVEAKAKAKREAKTAKGSACDVKAKVANSVKGESPPKYLHPKTGSTWTGHGRAPAWIAGAKDRRKFLIEGTDMDAASTAKPAAKKDVAVAGAGAHKGQRKGPQPAKYLDPKTGATWSGRGPAPAWLAAAKDRSKFLIADASAVATSAGAASKASKPKSSAASGAVAKKAAATNVVAKKAVAKKVTAKNEIAKKTAPAGKTAPAKKAARKSAAVTAPAATGIESTT